MADLRRESARRSQRPIRTSCFAGHGAPCESERGQSGLPLHVREFAKLWIARFYGNLSCKCFNLFGKHWIGGRTNLIRDGARSARCRPCPALSRMADLIAHGNHSFTVFGVTRAKLRES